MGRADLVFEDRHGRLLIVEVKHGTLPPGAIDQLLDYSGMMKRRYPGKPVEMMVRESHAQQTTRIEDDRVHEDFLKPDGSCDLTVAKS